MGKIIDLTGPIYNGMWNYEPPFPAVNIHPLPNVDWVETKVYCEVFAGLHSQTGTYLETPAHLLGYEASYRLSDIPIEKLVDIPTSVIHVTDLTPDETGRPPITAEMLIQANPALSAIDRLPENTALLISTGWGQRWRDNDFLSASPYFTREAMEYLIGKHPYLLGSDLPRWENLEKPQGFFPAFFRANILLASPFVNLEKITSENPLLTLLPLAVTDTCCAPVRAFIKETV